MGEFSGFSRAAQGFSGVNAGANAGTNAIASLVSDLVQRKRQQQAQAALAQQSSLAQAKLDEQAATGQENAGAKRLETMEKGAEHGLSLAPTLESPQQVNARVAGKYDEAADVARSGGQLLPEQQSAIDVNSIGGVLRAYAGGRDPNSSTILNPRAVGEHFVKDPSLRGLGGFKKGAAEDIAEQARLNAHARLGTEQLMQAIQSGVLQGKDVSGLATEWSKQQARMPAEMLREANGLIDLHEKNGELEPDEANRLRAYYKSTWMPPTPDQGPPPPATSSSSAAPPPAAPTNDGEAKTQLDAAASEKALADKYETMLKTAAIGAGEPEEGDVADAPPTSTPPSPTPPTGAGAVPSNAPNVVSSVMRGAMPITGATNPSDVSNSMMASVARDNGLPAPTPPPPTPAPMSLLPDLRGQLQQGPTEMHGTSLGLNGSPTPIVQRQESNMSPPGEFDDPIQRALNRAQQPPTISPPPPGQSAPQILAPIMQMLQSAANGPQPPPTPFIPQIGARLNPPRPPGGGSPFSLPGQGAPSSPPPPPSAMAPDMLQRARGFAQSLGLGGLGMPGASASTGAPGPMGPPMLPPPTPPNYTTSVMTPSMDDQISRALGKANAPHFPRPDELSVFPAGNSVGVLKPEAASAFQAALADPALSDVDRAALSRIASSTRSPDEQTALHTRYTSYMAANPNATPDQVRAATGIAYPPPLPGNTPPTSGHLAGSGLDLPADLSPAARQALAKAGWRQNVSGDPVHWEWRPSWG